MQAAAPSATGQWQAPAPFEDAKRAGKQRTYRPWTSAEVVALRELVATFGSDTKHWGTISRHMPGRSSKQCRDRWMNFMAEGINTDKWTPEEDLRVAAHHARYGPAWARLSKELNGRTQLAIKNRWHSTLRARAPQASRTVLHIYTNGLKAGKPHYDAYAEAYKFVTGSDAPDLELAMLGPVKCEPLDDLADEGSLSDMQGSEPATLDQCASPDGTECTYHHEATSRTASPMPTSEAASGYTQQDPPQRRLPHPQPPSASSPSSLPPSPPTRGHPPADLVGIPSINSLDASTSSHFSTHAPHPPSCTSAPASCAPPPPAPAPTNPLLRRHAEPYPSDAHKRPRLTCNPSPPSPPPSLSHTRASAPWPRPSPFLTAPQPPHPPSYSSQPRLSPYVSTTPLLTPRHRDPSYQPRTQCPPHTAPPQARRPHSTCAPPPHAHQNPTHDERSLAAPHHALLHELALLYARAPPPSCHPFGALSSNAVAALAELDARPPHWGLPLPTTVPHSTRPDSHTSPAPYPHPQSPAIHPRLQHPGAPTPSPTHPGPASLLPPPRQSPSPQTPFSSPFQAYAARLNSASTPSPPPSSFPASGGLRPTPPTLAARPACAPDAPPPRSSTRPSSLAYPAIRSAVTLRPTEAELWQRHQQLLRLRLQRQLQLFHWQQQQQQPQPPRRHVSLATSLFGQRPAGYAPRDAAAAAAAAAAPPTRAPSLGLAFRSGAPAGAAGDSLEAAEGASGSGDLQQLLSLAGSLDLDWLSGEVTQQLSEADVQDLLALP